MPVRGGRSLLQWHGCSQKSWHHKGVITAQELRKDFVMLRQHRESCIGMLSPLCPRGLPAWHCLASQDLLHAKDLLKFCFEPASNKEAE